MVANTTGAGASAGAGAGAGAGASAAARAGNWPCSGAGPAALTTVEAASAPVAVQSCAHMAHKDCTPRRRSRLTQKLRRTPGGVRICHFHVEAAAKVKPSAPGNSTTPRRLQGSLFRGNGRKYVFFAPHGCQPANRRPDKNRLPTGRR